MTFDKKKAARERLEALNGVMITLVSQTKYAEMRAAEATQQYDALLKLKGFLDGDIKDAMNTLRRLETEESK
jgi:hypothetical protein